MAAQIRDAKIFINGKLAGIATNKEMEKTSNNKTIKTDGGDIVSIGKPSGSYNMDVAVPNNDRVIGELNDKMDNNEEVEIIYGLVGTSRYQSMCTIDSLKLTGNTEDGMQTGSIQFTMVDGKAKRAQGVL